MPRTVRCGITCVQVRQPPFALVTRISPNCNRVSLSKCCGLGKYLSATGGEFRVISAVLNLAICRQSAWCGRCVVGFEVSRRSVGRRSRGRTRMRHALRQSRSDRLTQRDEIGWISITYAGARIWTNWSKNFRSIVSWLPISTMSGSEVVASRQTTPLDQQVIWNSESKQRRRNAVNVGGRLRRRFLQSIGL
jgi:hypothetical protein